MFFDERHHALAAHVRAVAPRIAACEDVAGDEAARDRAAVVALATSGLFAHIAPDGAHDVRGLCVIREALGWVSARADSIFAVQGLGAHPLLHGGETARALAARAGRGEVVLAFALTEPEAGSDVMAMSTRLTADGDGWILDGDKLFISNLGVATHAVVFATLTPGDKAGTRAVIVPLDARGATVVPLTATAPHPIGRLALRGCRVGREAIVESKSHGLGLALATLDTFRVTVGAAAVGMARRALAEAIAHVSTRVQFGAALAEQQLVQAHLADMIVDLDAARLLVLRAAYHKDHGQAARTEVSIAKLGATEAAQRVIDRAVQLLGGRGVMAGAVVEHLYRAIRPLRIYEGTSEIQRTLIGRAVARPA
ncbi:MAG: acyl-CoA dehydrogenase [Deltaproteobacteria bacterium]|nr:acyl-CoA dehydrogenase [Deltaproteobacteria bacterium]